MVKIIFNEDKIEISKYGAITGELYFQVKDTFFPAVNWSDFIVVILTWWNKSADLLATSSVGATANFSFMDGPFNIRGTKSEDSEKVTLMFVKRTSSGEEVLNTIDVDGNVLRHTILNVSRRVLKVIKNKDFQINNDDIVELEKIVSS
ncbi:hypothetical protein [Paenibacillus sp. MMS18-CY102]|uniref:hypothetical protein n=1 Tax=Paenibacillus sp. MMS18-CY102 TaxID=2682849 RepID=UPI001365ABD7|nr:hypothetical protein [Paenibacillus sp. MMS18-CY102]MWC28801.1 hypothetical protein [Paenibacillus sp. MMS18-CY102]